MISQDAYKQQLLTFQHELEKSLDDSIESDLKKAEMDNYVTSELIFLMTEGGEK